MPELPEVEVVRRGIEPYSTGWLVERVQVFDPRALKRHEGPAEDFIHRLTGRVLGGAVRRGKFLWLPLSAPADESPAGDEALVCHLGMSGQVLLGEHPEQFGPLLRVALELRGPAGEAITWGFVDQRLFGSLAIDRLVEASDTRRRPPQPGVPAGCGGTDSRLPASVWHIGRDLLDPAVDDAVLARAIRAKSSGIKRVLLDQRLTSGVGNIYADEALYRARLHYDYPASRLSHARAMELLGHVRQVFHDALAEGGTSFDWQYVNVNGQSGYFSQSLSAYGQDGTSCGRCGRTIVREPFMNRSSFRCPRCQPTPRKRVG
jgi:formamidopyrimidine-DNA glycosylase